MFVGKVGANPSKSFLKMLGRSKRPSLFQKEIELGRNQCDQMIGIKIGPFLKKVAKTVAKPKKYKSKHNSEVQNINISKHFWNLKMPKTLAFLGPFQAQNKVLFTLSIDI